MFFFQEIKRKREISQGTRAKERIVEKLPTRDHATLKAVVTGQNGHGHDADRTEKGSRYSQNGNIP